MTELSSKASDIRNTSDESDSREVVRKYVLLPVAKATFLIEASTITAEIEMKTT